MLACRVQLQGLVEAAMCSPFTFQLLDDHLLVLQLFVDGGSLPATVAILLVAGTVTPVGSPILWLDDVIDDYWRLL